MTVENPTIITLKRTEARIKASLSRGGYMIKVRGENGQGVSLAQLRPIKHSREFVVSLPKPDDPV